MPHLFSSSRLKIERADKHIADIQAIVSRLPDAYTPRIERDAKTGSQIVLYGLDNPRQVAQQIGLVIGDAIHNLKSAIDHAWFSALSTRRTVRISTKAKFPVYPTREQLQRSLIEGEIDKTIPALYDFILTEVKPYDGGNDTIRALHKLDISDKHRLLVPLLNIAFIQGMEIAHEGGMIQRFDHAMTRGPFRYPLRRGSKLNKGRVGASVVFHQGTPTHDREVLSVLAEFREVVRETIKRMEELRYE